MGEVRVLQPMGSINRRTDATFGALSVKEIPVEKIERDEKQGRVEFEPVQLQALVDSVKAEGVLQPVGVYAIAWDTPQQLTVTRYRLIFGERRWRAAQLAGLKTIPARLFQTAEEGRAAEAELRRIAQQKAENAMRVALTAVEDARLLRRELDVLQRVEPDRPMAELVERVAGGKDGSYIYKLLGLLEAPESLQLAIRKGRITSRDVAFQFASYWSSLEKKNASVGASKREVQFRRKFEEWAKARGTEPSPELVPQYAAELGLDAKMARQILKAAEKVDRAAEMAFDALVERAAKEGWTVKDTRQHLKDGSQAGKRKDQGLPLFERSDTKGRARFLVHLDRMRQPEVTAEDRAQVVQALRSLADELEQAAAPLGDESAAGQ
jgi:ParB/RepB/Spo0J family partition protein